MEKIGQTGDDGIIAKFTRGEWQQLEILQAVANGELVQDAGHVRVPYTDMTPTFETIRLWIDCQMRLDALDIIVKRGRYLLGLPDEQPEGPDTCGAPRGGV